MNRFRVWCKSESKLYKDLAISTVSNMLGIGDVLMQSTGLVDVNKETIYEGDILKCDRGNLYRVYKAKGGFVINIGVKIWQKDILRASVPIPNEPLAEMQTRGWLEASCEVIGNIYENFNLIEEYLDED